MMEEGRSPSASKRPEAPQFDKIVTMIRESEKLKSSLEGGKQSIWQIPRFPYSLFGTGLTWLITRNTTKALSYPDGRLLLCP